MKIIDFDLFEILNGMCQKSENRDQRASVECIRTNIEQLLCSEAHIT